MSRWSTLLLDEADLGRMPALTATDVVHHGDAVTGQRLKPRELYQRWEKQQWSAEAVELGPDREDFRTKISGTARDDLASSIATFIIGEYTGLDLLGPILTGAPDEEGHLYLGTQIADEARHTQLMLRLGDELLGLGSEPEQMLRACWDLVSPAHREMSLLETRLVHELQQRPSDYAAWLRTVAMFHLVTEGMLALVGQRVIVQELQGAPLLDGVKTSFTAMCRDESRHVSYGLHALRQGIREGYGDCVYEVLEEAIPIAVRIDEDVLGGSDAEQPRPWETDEDIERRATADARLTARRAEAQQRRAAAQERTIRELSLSSLARQLRLIDADPTFSEHLQGLGRKAVNGRSDVPA